MTARDVDTKIAGIARRQHCVFNREQAHAVGATNRIIARRLASGAWLVLADNVFCLPGAPATWQRQVEGARLEAGVQAVAFRRTAAALHGFEGARRLRPEILVAARGPSALTLGDVHRTRDLPSVDRCVVDGIPTTTPERTIIDLAGIVEPHRLTRTIDDQLARGQVDAVYLAERFVALASRGRSGVRVLRPIIEARLPDSYEPPQSELEAVAASCFRKAGLPEPDRQFHLPWRPAWNGWVDFAWPRHRVLVEVDGRTWHARMDQMMEDRRRDREAALNGFILLRYGWLDFARHGEMVADEVRRALHLAA